MEGTLADFPTRVGNQPRRILHGAHSVNTHSRRTMKRTDFGIEPGSATIRSQGSTLAVARGGAASSRSTLGFQSTSGGGVVS